MGAVPLLVEELPVCVPIEGLRVGTPFLLNPLYTAVRAFENNLKLLGHWPSPPDRVV